MKKIIYQNLSIAFVAKIISFISFIYIAKELRVGEYGVFVYINMCLSLMPILQFGSMHGTVILLPKYLAREERDGKSLFFSYNVFSCLLKILVAPLLLMLKVQVSLYVVSVIITNFVLQLYVANAQIYLNAQLRFGCANAIKLSDQIIRSFFVLGFFSYYKDIESIFYAQLLATSVTIIVSFVFVEIEIVDIRLKEFVNNIYNIYKVGFFVYLSWGVDLLFRISDRWYISFYYPKEDLASYGFVSSLAINIWMLSMGILAPYSQLLYKAIAENNFIESKRIILNTNNKLYVFVGWLSVSAIVGYPLLLKFIVHKYQNTFVLFVLLVSVSVLLVANNMYIYYMISTSKYKVLLFYQFFILMINVVANSVFSVFGLPIVCFAYSTIFSLGVYFVLTRRFYVVDINKRLSSL